jgi:hypothetical protein
MSRQANSWLNGFLPFQSGTSSLRISKGALIHRVMQGFTLSRNGESGGFFKGEIRDRYVGHIMQGQSHAGIQDLDPHHMPFFIQIDANALFQVDIVIHMYLP